MTQTFSQASIVGVFIELGVVSILAQALVCQQICNILSCLFVRQLWMRSKWRVTINVHVHLYHCIFQGLKSH